MKILKEQFLFVLALVVLSGFLVPVVSHAASNITSNTTYAWGDVLGWVNFSPTNGNVTVTDTAITGYAWSAASGWINLARTNGGVVNDGHGNLSGKAWGANTGWIDFSGVVINSSGQFTGHTASSTLAGVINFSCANCLVTTNWRPAGTTITPPANTQSSSQSGSHGGSIALASTVLATTSPTNNSVVHSHTKKPGSLPLSVSGKGVRGSVSTHASGTVPVHIQKFSHTPNISTSSEVKAPGWQHSLMDVIRNASFRVKILGGASLIVLLGLLLWRLII